jgi:hypothetical protein
MVMQSWLLKNIRASVWATAVIGANLTGGSASAADLYNTYPSPRTGSAYEDPRYADLYGTPPPPPSRYEERYAPSYKPPHEHRYSHPVPSEPIYPDRTPRQYSEVYPSPRAYSAGPRCLAKDEISYNLERDGWREFHDPQVIDRGTAYVKARRQGRMFQLKLDRCSGDIIAARPIDQRGPYADYERPYRTY